MYVKMMCPYCIRAKRLLDEKGIPYESYPVDFNGSQRQKMIERARGRTTVPQIFVDGTHIGGCDELLELDHDGRLDELLSA